MRPFPVRLAALAALLLAPAAQAKSVLDTTLGAQRSVARSCTSLLPSGAGGVATTTARADETGTLRLVASGAGDWDVTVFDRTTGRFIAGSAQPGGRELATGFVAEGQRLRVQACRFDGDAGTVRLRAAITPIKLVEGGYKAKVVVVRTPTRAAKDRLGLLGLDPAEGATRTTVDVVLHDADDEARLRRAGFAWTVRIADLAKQTRRSARSSIPQARAAALPSGRTDYRRLADYEADMKMLAAKNPGLVRLIQLNHKTLEGRAVLGLEIARNVNVDDGKPVFLQLGVHHAREWPAGEAPLEFAFDLVANYGKVDRFTNIVDNSRTIVVPLVNPDGFNLSREATAGQTIDPGVPLGEANDALPDQIQQNGTLDDPVYIAALLGDQLAGTFAYKRRNCRIKDGETPKPGDCANRDNRTRGTDPNRNYGGLWGGPGASTSPTNDTYRGAAPFSEPETQNVRELVLANQVTTLITNHTFTGLVLYPPGVRAQGEPVDGPALKDLSDRMAAQVGYKSQPGYELYDTTGTTEDWSYSATGGFGYTFEIGKKQFHPPYGEFVSEYEGSGALAGKGLRAAYLLGAENTIDQAKHSVLKGTAPPGSVLRVTKTFDTLTSPVIGADGKVGPEIAFTDTINDAITVGNDGTFEWSLNPSTRPGVQRERTTSEPADEPSSSKAFSSTGPVLPNDPMEVEIQVTEGMRLIRAFTKQQDPNDIDDYDLYLYEGSVAPANQVASSATGGSDETLVFDYPKAGKYVLQVVNFAAAGPVSGGYEVYGAKPGTSRTIPAQKESYTLTCETPTGQVLTTNPLQIDRGQTLTMSPCGKNEGPGQVAPVAPVSGSGTTSAAAGPAPAGLRFKLAVRKRALRKALRGGLRVVANCTIECRVVAAASVPKKVAKRFGLGNGAARLLVARGAMKQAESNVNNRVITLRFTKKARKRLRNAKLIRFVVRGLATNREGDTARKVVRVKIRR